MSSISSVLVATDLTVSSQPALARAQEIARRAGARLHVLFVRELHKGSRPWLDEPDLQWADREVEARTRRELEALTEGSSVEVSNVIERDTGAAQAILRYAQSHDMDLIVVGTHARGTLGRMFLGSVAEKVVRCATTSVLVVGPDGAAVPACRCIVAATDFSAGSDGALRAAAELATRHEAQLLIAHVVDPLQVAPYFTDEFLAARRRSALRDLGHIVRVLPPELHAEPHLLQGRAHEQIVDLARHVQADLVVVGACGLQGMDRWLLGSVAERVVRAAPCPVWVHHDKRSETPETLAHNDEEAVS